MPTKNVNLSAPQAKFIQQSIKKGDYRNASEVVRAALQLLQKQEKEYQTKVAALRQMVKEAERSYERGEGVTLRSRDELHDYLDGLAAKPRKKKSA